MRVGQSESLLYMEMKTEQEEWLKPQPSHCVSTGDSQYLCEFSEEKYKENWKKADFRTIPLQIKSRYISSLF